MPTQKTITAYTFAELSEQAKEKAREWMRECTSSDMQWADGCEDDAKQVGAELKEWDANRGTAKVHMDDPDTTASLIMENHGDGTGTFTAAKTYMDACAACIDMEDEPRGEAIEEARATFYSELGRAYGKMLRDEYEYRLSDEAIDEDIEANEYLFTETGSRCAVL